MWATPDVARAGPTSARRRRERRIRSFFRHEQMAIKLAVVSAQHHSSQRCCSVATQTGVEVPATVYAATASPVAACAASAASLMGEYVDPVPVVPAPVFGSVAPAPAVTYSAPVPVFEYVAPAPVFGFAPAPAGSFVAPSQQLRPAYTTTAVSTGVNLDADFVGSASQVVGSLPHGEVFAGPGFYQVHHEHIAAVPTVTEFFPMSDDEGGELSAGLRPAPLWGPCRKFGSSGTPWSTSRTSCVSLPWCRSSMHLCRRRGISCRTSCLSSVRSCLIPSRLSMFPRSFSMMSLCALLTAIRSWGNSWWKCRRSLGMSLLFSPRRFVRGENFNRSLQGYREEGEVHVARRVPD